eukprot:4229658-Amphidinium_carterae.1
MMVAAVLPKLSKLRLERLNDATPKRSPRVGKRLQFFSEPCGTYAKDHKGSDSQTDREFLQLSKRDGINNHCAPTLGKGNSFISPKENAFAHCRAKDPSHAGNAWQGSVAC